MKASAGMAVPLSQSIKPGASERRVGPGRSGRNLVGSPPSGHHHVGQQQDAEMLGDAELAAYFARIGYAGPREPTLAVLRGIVAAHATSIPFENLEVLLRRGVKLDAEALFDKLVERRRGGY